MLQHQLPPKNSPARRRQKRPINSPARKTYASESDMPSEALFQIELSGPLTPQKSASNSPVPSAAQSSNSAKPRARNGNGSNNNNKSRAKQQTTTSSTSPAPTRQARQTPPQTAPPRPALAAAFAGSTFHASPAPSSLPIPTFLKGLDSPGIKDTGRSSQEPSPPATDSEAPTPRHRQIETDISRQESPLDLFFRADRAEKERARRASIANIVVASTGPGLCSPPVAAQSPHEPRTVPNGFGTARTRRPLPQRNPSTGIPSHELDGTPGMPIGPSFSTPFGDRIRAARSNDKPATPTQQTQPAQQTPQQQHPTTDASQRLKAFLSVGSAAPATGHQNQPLASPTRTTLSEFSSPARTQQYPQPMATPTRQEHARPANILSMEDTLRRVLKMDGLNLGTAPPNNYNYQSS